MTAAAPHSTAAASIAAISRLAGGGLRPGKGPACAARGDLNPQAVDRIKAQPAQRDDDPRRPGRLSLAEARDRR